ncbi:hypothetical protein [Sinorhizobium meliloti]|uniref:hypothetical protein n=1 Tax=Rhizobium meliloti TaxID=382 RepID=UPI000FDBA861|nr:hypothetical protein [Sinorhizobium meliloti]RVH36099.1 hypothetical protein CN211_12400 [Sinorhizobium meliloti]
MPKPYRVVEYDSGPKGMPGMEALINECAARGDSLHQVVRESTYRWILILSLNAPQSLHNQLEATASSV